MKPDPTAPNPSEPTDFSLVLGGPLYQIFRRTHLSGDSLELLWRRVIFLTLLAWLPLLLLSILEGRAWGGDVELPFLKDVDTHARLLLSLPMFVAAELLVHQRVRLVVGSFLKRGLVPAEARARFDAAVASALRLRNSVLAEVLLIAFVYGIGVLVIWRSQAAMDMSTWYDRGQNPRLVSTLAGVWLGFVSLPLVQFILLRWWFRLFIWMRFLWQVSRVRLRLVPTHPDRACGLGFVGVSSLAFAPLLAGQGVLLAGLMANRIFYAGARLTDFKLELAAMVMVMVLFVLAPLLVFVPLLARTKRVGLAEYGGLAQRYAREFDEKWLRGGAAAGEPLLGSADIQSLADLGNSYEVVKGIRLVPFSRDVVLQLTVISLAPVAPLVLTLVPLTELLDRFLQVLL